ncbi:Metallo-dependent phosphatase-like protein [Lineolata rhizophorae]|uniref:Metallo-dependent phosphatase-like protein n=1 Tax=Lineolata rhizophorae TaxID=578093 RepID=A0A6A6P2L9_9PEZI|nr:Metallo-dependent phosphatase-like protein [Lineolata rhizophorae]
MLFFHRQARSEFDPQPTLSLILTSPLNYVIRLLYRLLQSLRTPPSPSDPPIRVVCISDSHTLTQPLPDGDVLIHAGDLTNAGTPAELQSQIDWLASQPHRHKIAIAGNHDAYLDPRSRKTLPASDRTALLDWTGVHYLQHSSLDISFHSPPQASNHSHRARTRRLVFYGAPQIPACGGPEFAFQYARGRDAWSETVPNDTDVLITHTPPKWHLDLPVGLGCEWLLKETWRVRPLLHVCGHVHAAAGREYVWWDQEQATYERAVNRRGGIIRDMFDIVAWFRFARIAYFGFRSLLWDKVWGGEVKGSILVNAALMYQNSGELGNPVQVVDI